MEYPRMKKTRTINLSLQIHRIFIVCLLLQGILLPAISLGVENPQVLVLNSYHQSFYWTDKIMEGIGSAFHENGLKVDMYVENMDTKRFFDGLNGKFVSGLKKMYKDKYGLMHIDVIIASDDNALQFLLAYGRDLFPDTPIVFCGVNHFSDVMLEGHHNITGVLEVLDRKETIDLALKLHPDVKTIAVITDTAPTGRGNRKELEKLADEYAPSIEFMFLDPDKSGISHDELLAKVKALPKDSIIFFSDFHIDKHGQAIDQRALVEALSRLTMSPIYTNYSSVFGEKVFGGKLNSPYFQGWEAGIMALRILQGEPVGNIPVLKSGPNRFMFNYDQIKRFGIREQNLPADSVVVNKPASFYEKHKILICSLVFLFAIETIIIFLLIGNIRRRQKAEKTLKKSEERYAAAQRAATAGSWDWDILSGRLEWSEQIASIFGFDREKFPGTYDAVLERVHPDDRHYVVDAVIAALGAVKDYHIEHRIIWPNGAVRWVSVKGEILGDESGKAVRMLGIVMDVSKRKQAEEALYEAKQLLSNAVDNAAIGMVLVRMDGVFHQVNRAFCDIIGYTEEELLGKTLQDITHPEDYGLVKGLIEKLRTGKALSVDFKKRFIHKQGEVVHVHLIRVLLKDDQETPLFYFDQVQDITKQVKSDRELKKYKDHLEDVVETRTRDLTEKTANLEKTQKALTFLLEDVNEARAEIEHINRELEAVNRELKDFAYIVSHDLKAPLRAVSQLAFWISQDYAESFDHEGKEQLNLLINRVKRMDALINGILEYSRLSRGRTKKESIDLNKLLADCVESLAPPEHIRITVQPSLPAVNADQTRMSQVFQNLIGNAIKFMDKSQGVVQVECIDKGDKWEFRITDNGPGIEEKYFDKIFQIFQTLTSRDEKENTGIGLTLAKKIVEQLGGKIWLESKIGHGTTFFFTLATQ
jgi:PAS domain S-box-containing protein